MNEYQTIMNRAEMEAKIERLEKALDYACDILHIEIRNRNHHIDRYKHYATISSVPVMTKEEWKEWCFHEIDRRSIH